MSLENFLNLLTHYLFKNLNLVKLSYTKQNTQMTNLQINQWSNHEDIEKLNRPVTSKEIESIVKTLPTKKSLGPSSFTGELNQTFEELKRRGTHSKSFFEGSFSLILKYY